MAEVRPLDDLDNATASLDEIINLADQELKAQSGRRTSHQYTLKNVPAEQKLIPPPSQLQQPSGTTHIEASPSRLDFGNLVNNITNLFI